MRGIDRFVKRFGPALTVGAIALLSAACKKRESGGDFEGESGMEPTGMLFGAMESLGALIFIPIFVLNGYWFLCFWDRRDDPAPASACLVLEDYSALPRCCAIMKES